MATIKNCECNGYATHSGDSNYYNGSNYCNCNAYDGGVRRYSWPTASWSASIDKNSKITKEVITELRNAIYTEQDIRNIARTSFTTLYKGNKIDSSSFSSLIEPLNSCRNVDKSYSLKNSSGTIITWNLSWPTIAKTNKITPDIITAIRNNIIEEEHTCICQCNYCTCNCNYCSCHPYIPCSCDNYSEPYW